MNLQSQWQILNGLRKPDARLIYSPVHDSYFLMPGRMQVEKGDVSGLLARQLIVPAEGPKGVYRISAAGRTRWTRLPREMSIEGTCDRCGEVRDLNPVTNGLSSELLCVLCCDCSEEVVTWPANAA